MDANRGVGRATGFPLKLAGTKNGRVSRKHGNFLCEAVIVKRLIEA
jgi:hypothetical protein